jgi:hypothetical protein
VVGGSVGGNMSAEHRGGWSANVDRMLRAPPRALPAAASAVTEVLARVRLPGEVVLRRLYGVVGEGLGPVVDAVSRHEAVQWIQVRHRGHGPVMPTG